MNVAEQVETLEREVDDLRELCGEIMATLRVNIARDTLVCTDPAAFDVVLNGWGYRMGKAGVQLPEDER